MQDAATAAADVLIVAIAAACSAAVVAFEHLNKRELFTPTLMEFERTQWFNLWNSKERSGSI